MLRFILTRVSLVIPTFIGMTVLAFFLIRLVPGDPIETMAGERGIDAERHAKSAQGTTASTGRCWCSTASTSAACCTATSASRSSRRSR
jgi:ABC-type dipeptide/oligopeptide/nickel transport system permease component